jgi:glutamate decarboxylase
MADGHYPGEDTTLYERHFTDPLPDHALAEESLDPRAALAIVESEMLLDGTPEKNLATFVTTWMEPEARVVIERNLHRNFIDHAEYPRTAEIGRRCLRSCTTSSTAAASPPSRVLPAPGPPRP